MSISPNGKYVVTSGHDKTLRLWEKTQEPLVLDDERENEREKEEEEQLATGNSHRIFAIRSIEQFTNYLHEFGIFYPITTSVVCLFYIALHFLVVKKSDWFRNLKNFCFCFLPQKENMWLAALICRISL